MSVNIAALEGALHQLQTVGIAWAAITTVIVGLRLFTRQVYLKKIGIDDYLMLLAWVSISAG